MYHYQKNIGDYRSATMHLSLLEHGVYNQLLDWYYLDEQPLPVDTKVLFRRLSARSEAEQAAVVDVLGEMFTQTDAGWVHKRVERELEAYRAKAGQARAAGRLGGRPAGNRDGSFGNRDGSFQEPVAKPTINHEPLTVNQEPEEKDKSRNKQVPGEAGPLPLHVVPTQDHKKHALPSDWVIDEEWGTDAERIGWKNAKIHTEAERFRQYWVTGAGAGRKKTAREWRQSWANWMNNCDTAHAAAKKRRASEWLPTKRSSKKTTSRAPSRLGRCRAASAGR